MKYSAVIEPEIRKHAPEYILILIEAEVRNSATPEELTSEINLFGQNAVSAMEMADINRRPGIAATRRLYSSLGKEPNRYRPSHEQMMRRFFKGQGLYTVSAIVDAGNLLSLKSGYSVGVFDAGKISGTELRVGVGAREEPYEGIGRGPLNIENLPVVRDAEGGIGTPTSDNERTKISDGTRNIVITIHAFAQEMPVDETIELARSLLERYCSLTNFEYTTVS